MNKDINIVNPKRIRNKNIPSNTIHKIIIVIITLAIVGGVGFFSGVSYQKNKNSAGTSSSTNNVNAAPNSNFKRRPRGYRVFGTVTAISQSSISVQLASGTTQTYSITSTTVIREGGQTIAYSSIKIGDNVVVGTSSSTSLNATRIVDNTSNGSGGGTSGNPATSSPPTLSN